MYRLNSRDKRAGFTLIELMVAVGLMVILIGAVVFVFSQTTGIFNEADARMQIYQNARLSIDKIEEALVSALPITDPNQHFILINQWTNSPQLAGSCDAPNICSFNQGDAVFFYGTTYVSGQPVTGYIMYRMGDYDEESDSYRLKVYVIPLTGILPDGTLIDTNPEDFNSTAPPGTEVMSDELCQYVRAVRIKYNYTDAWPSQYNIDTPPGAAVIDTAAPAFPAMMNLLPYPWQDGTGLNAPLASSELVGGFGDNDLRFDGSSSTTPGTKALKLHESNSYRFLKRYEEAVLAQPDWTTLDAINQLGPTNPVPYSPFWFFIGDDPAALLLGSERSITSLNNEHNPGSAGGPIIPKPIEWTHFAGGTGVPGDPNLINPSVNGFQTFRWRPTGGFTFRLTPGVVSEPAGWNTKNTGAFFLRFKIFDVDWEDENNPGTYLADADHPLGIDFDTDGEPDYPGNAIRVKGSDMLDGTDHFIVKKLPSSIEVTMRVVDQFRFSTRIISKIIYLPVN